MESLGYVLLYFFHGSLRRATDQQSYATIMEKMKNAPAEDLCKGLPSEFETYLTYTRDLPFEDQPDYSYLRKIFCDLFIREGFRKDYVFDWTVIKYVSTEDLM